VAEVRPVVGLGVETGRKNGAHPDRVMRADLNPYQMACHRMVESGDASAVSHRETGPTREPYHVSSTRLDAAGNGRFSGARQVPGADVWLASETSRSLDPDGCLVRRPHGRYHAKENRGASEATSRGVECAQRNATEKSCQKLCKGEVLPLDRSLLMGVFPIHFLYANNDPRTTLAGQSTSWYRPANTP
jgi:hypothetical protein